VVWRDGVHILGTPIWCDARRPREVCFASRYEAVPAARHGQLIATAETLALYGGAGAASRALPSPCGRPFTLGTVRLELVRAGAGLGAASLALEVAGVRVVYAGKVGRGEGLAGGADMRACDVLVLDSDHADADVRFPPLEDAVSWIAEQWQAAAGAGGALVVIVGSALDGLDLMAQLAPRVGRAPVVQRGLGAVAERARALVGIGPALPTVRRASGRMVGGDLVLWPMRRLAGLARLELPAGSRRVLVAGHAAEPGAAARVEADAALAWSLAADGADALAYVRACGARAVFLTGRGGTALATALAGEGMWARALGPPQQMSLF